MAGRIPKSAEQKLREGRPGHHPPRVPVIIGGRVTVDDLPTLKPPARMSRTERAAWREIIAPLVAGGMIDRVDLSVVELAARALALVREATDAIADEGIFSENSQGRVAHPAVAIAKGAMTEFRLLATTLGIGPSSRVKLGAEASAGSLRAPHEGGMAGELGRTLPARARLSVVGDDADPD